MRSLVTLPRVSDTVDMVVVTRLLVSEGDAVEVGTPLIEVDADKITVEIPSPVAGRVMEILVHIDDEIPTGDHLVTIDGLS